MEKRMKRSAGTAVPGKRADIPAQGRVFVSGGRQAPRHFLFFYRISFSGETEKCLLLPFCTQPTRNDWFLNHVTGCPVFGSVPVILACTVYEPASCVSVNVFAYMPLAGS